MRRTWLLVAVIIVVVSGLMGLRAKAGPSDLAAAALESLFRSERIDASRFANAFTAQVPLSTVAALVDDYRRRLGALVSTTKAGSDYALDFTGGTVRATIALSPDGTIAALSFHDETTAASRAALLRLFTEPTPPTDVFSAAFLAQIPITQIAALTKQIAAEEGKFVRLDLRQGVYYAVFERAENRVLAATDAAGRFTMLRLLPPTSGTSSLNDALRRLRERSGDVSYLILEGRTDVAALSAERPMAVGSAFKLAILAALREEIDAKRRTWADIVPLAAVAKSLPSGSLQNWPTGTPITLATYAAQMISVSDNTAADALAHVVGRNALEALSPRNAPFLSTREMFALKTKDVRRRTAYRAGDEPARRAIVAQIDVEPVPLLESLDLEPQDLDVEWYFTTRELCSLMTRVHDLDLTTINPGVAAAGFARNSYKGGSDSGVLSLTNYITTPRGRSHCVSATWNDRTRTLDESSFVAAYQAVLEQLARR